MKPTILIQLDTDEQPSVFDAVVAIDAGAENLLRHSGVTSDRTRDLVHGALFTRGQGDLHRTAIFIGGSEVAAGEAVLKAVRESFFGPFQVSVMLDSNGANTTAAAAVLAAMEGAEATLGAIDRCHVAVLGATGPVGRRVARLLLGLGRDVRVSLGSRNLQKAEDAAEQLEAAGHARPTAFASGDSTQLARALEGIDIVIAAGAAGACLLPLAIRKAMQGIVVAIDLNAVPPLGIEGIDAADKRVDRDGTLAWGALGVGGTKMKIHKAAIRSLFDSNDRVIDAEECLALGQSLST